MSINVHTSKRRARGADSWELRRWAAIALVGCGCGSDGQLWWSW